MPDEITLSGIDNHQSPNFVSIYSNNVAVAVNFFDVSLIFGEMTGTTPEGKLTVEQRARVTMSPAHTKVLIAALIDQLVQYELRFGDIVLPDEVSLPRVGGIALKAVSDANRLAATQHSAGKQGGHED